MSTTQTKRTVYGMCYFPTYTHAISYYGEYEDDVCKAVELKLREGSIHIGKPEAKPGQRLFVQDNRWHVEEVQS